MMTQKKILLDEGQRRKFPRRRILDLLGALLVSHPCFISKDNNFFFVFLLSLLFFEKYGSIANVEHLRNGFKAMKNSLM